MNARHLLLAGAIASLSLFALSASSRAASDKQLENVKGSVSYEAPHGAPIEIAPKAGIDLVDQDYAITGDASLGQVTLPDSSQVLVGSQSKVQLAFFNQAAIADAKFVLYNGRVRFAVRHPKGAKADYTFQTPTGDVAVRGTQGDVEYDRDGSLRVNVYEVCNPSEPVRVTTKNGQTFTIVAGQSLFARIVNGVVRAQIQQLTQQLIDRFAPDFGVPSSWDAAKGRVVAYAQNTAQSAENAAQSQINSATGGLAPQLPPIGGLFGHKATPKPSPKPTPATCQ